MGLFGGPEEQKRRRALRELEDKRLALAERAGREGLRFAHALYAQSEGGFVGIALDTGGGAWWVSGPAPMQAGGFELIRLDRATFCVERALVEGSGMYGVFGMGQKGGQGYKLLVRTEEGLKGELRLIPAIDCALEDDGRNVLFSTRRRRGDANFTWDFQPVDRAQLRRLMEKWSLLLGINGPE